MLQDRKDDSLGIYISIPFCKAKCSFCNFASDVFAGQRIDTYLDRVLLEIAESDDWAAKLDARMTHSVDTIYLGGGTPSLLGPAHVTRLFSTIREMFNVDLNAEITVEAAPRQLASATLAALVGAGVNRLSFGVQSFVDAECAAVGRLHTGQECRAELKRMADAGVKRVGIDLIAGLPGQTAASWRTSVEQAIESGVEHVSIYMLEIDEDSRLGREKISGGGRYGAGSLPDDDSVAENYAFACEWLNRAGLAQYEISNFARAGGESRHNRRYWERRPYLGFGLDAHSMLRVNADATGAVRWGNAETMDHYMHGLSRLDGQDSWQRTVDRIDQSSALEESLFLGLRLVEGVSMSALDRQFGRIAVARVADALQEVIQAGLLTRSEDRLQLTANGRLLSNEVFSRLLLQPSA